MVVTCCFGRISRALNLPKISGRPPWAMLQLIQDRCNRSFWGLQPKSIPGSDAEGGGLASSSRSLAQRRLSITRPHDLKTLCLCVHSQRLFPPASFHSGSPNSPSAVPTPQRCVTLQAEIHTWVIDPGVLVLRSASLASKRSEPCNRLCRKTAGHPGSVGNPVIPYRSSMLEPPAPIGSFLFLACDPEASALTRYIGDFALGKNKLPGIWVSCCIS